MPDIYGDVVLVFDDRELVQDDVRSLVGRRRFGEIIFKRQTLFQRFRDCMPPWALPNLFHLRTAEDVSNLRGMLEGKNENTRVCFIAGRSGFADVDRVQQMIERLPYAEEDFTDRLYKPLLVFMKDAHGLVNRWSSLEASPLHLWEQAWQESQRIEFLQPLDLAQIQDFLSFTSGSTSTRHFNRVDIDRYYYKKSSSDKRKMLAEFSFYQLVPESIRPWLIEPFDYQEHGDRSSYKMLRYYLADSALQWVHGAFDENSFRDFVDRLLFFIAERPRRKCNKKDSLELAREIFLSKVEKRISQFLASEEGCRVNNLAASATPDLDISVQFERYKKLYSARENGFVFDYSVIGHGDPCFSNILYDQKRFLLKLIDPKGAVDEAGLYTHPLYDLCKISHSALGDYDFINNGLHSIGFSESNDMTLDFSYSNQTVLKEIFEQRLLASGYDSRMVRLGEASLFLSMLPLHLDHPNKVLAFMLQAKKILDEVECV